MPRPYNKKTVEQAILLLECLASSSEPSTNEIRGGKTMLFEIAADDLGVPQHSTAFRLAERAIDAVDDQKIVTVYNDEGFRSLYVEAAALVRSGWRIGDDVEMLPVASNVVSEHPVSPYASPLSNVCEAAALAVTNGPTSRVLEASAKDYSDTEGRTIDDGPIEVDPLDGGIFDQPAQVDGLGQPLAYRAGDGTPVEVVGVGYLLFNACVDTECPRAHEPHETSDHNGDYGADS